MRVARLAIISLFLVLLILALFWLDNIPARTTPTPASTTPTTSPGKVLRLGLIPERDIFAQRKSYQALAAYLGAHLGTEIQLRTVNTYQGVLDDFQTREVDFAFVGSLIAVLTIDRLHADVLLKPVYPGEISTYSGVIVVPEDSPIRTLDDLRNHSLGTVRTTTAGHLFPMALLAENNMLHVSDAPRIVWVGTHDDVLREVLAGRIDAGALKDLRLTAFETRHPEFKFRRLAESQRVSENALLVRHNMPADLREKIRDTLLEMDHDPAGRTVLDTLGALRFTPCPVNGYDAVYDMIDRLGPAWKEMGIPGDPPHRRSPEAPVN